MSDPHVPGNFLKIFKAEEQDAIRATTNNRKNQRKHNKNVLLKNVYVIVHLFLSPFMFPGNMPGWLAMKSRCLRTSAIKVT